MFYFILFSYNNCDTFSYLILRLMPVDLLANIGGIFGFFLGISFLSFVEIIEIMLEGLFFVIGKKI